MIKVIKEAYNISTFAEASKLKICYNCKNFFEDQSVGLNWECEADIPDEVIGPDEETFYDILYDQHFKKKTTCPYFKSKYSDSPTTLKGRGF